MLTHGSIPSNGRGGDPGVSRRTAHEPSPSQISGHACRNVPPKMLRTGSPSHLSQFTPEIAPLNRRHTSSPPTEHQPVCNTRAALERLSTVLTETDWRNWSARPPSATTTKQATPSIPLGQGKQQGTDEGSPIHPPPTRKPESWSPRSRGWSFVSRGSGHDQAAL